MEFAVAVAVCIGGLLLLYVLWHMLTHSGMLPMLSTNKGVRYPPVQTGWIPWVGCAVSFGREPLFYIQNTREKLGDVFTIHAAGKRMTFITNPQHYQHYFTTTKTDFQAAVQPFTMGAAGLSSESFFKYHSAIHDTIKGRLVPTYLTKMCPILSQEFHTSLLGHGDGGEMELMDFVRDPMFEAVVRQLFGHDNVPKERDEMRQFMKKFIKFDADFEYGVELPEIFLRDWRECKYWLLSVFKLMVEGIREKHSHGKQGGTLVEQLMKNVDEPSAHNYALLLLWASQANAVPAVFWTLGYILSNQDVYKSIKDDLKQLRLTGEDGGLTEANLKEVLSVKRCVLEAVRLRSPGMITRKVMETHSVNGYTIPAGHLLMLSPYWSHRNEEKFPNPEKFDPDRWLKCDLGKNQFLDGFVGFGGGRYQCPGRWFALMEMHIFVAMVLSMFDLELLDPLPPPSPLHLVGTQQPTATCRIRYKRC